MPVRFTPNNGITEELIPAPFVTINKTFVRDSSLVILHPVYTITLEGKIVNVGNEKDSPYMSNSTLGDMDDILGEQERIRNLFDSQGGRLEIEAPEGGGPNTLDTYCTVDGVDFESSTWTTLCSYRIILTSYKLEDEDEPTGLSSFNENWSFQENINGTVALTHSLAAAAVPIYGIGGVINDPLTVAKTWCYDKSVVINDSGNLSYYNIPSGTLNLSSLLINLGTGSGNFWNKAIRESTSLSAFSWEVEESFLYDPSGIALEEYKLVINRDDEDIRKNNISITGTITGNAGLFDNLPVRNSRAKAHFENNVSPNLYTRINSYVDAGYSTNPVPSSRQISYNIDQGTLEYSYSFIATSGFLFAGAIDETISIVDTASTDIFAQIQIPGKISGPLFQNMETVTAPERTVNIGIIFSPSATGMSVSSILGMYLSKPNTDAIISALVPSTGFYYITNNSEEWNPIKRQYSRNVSWAIDSEASTIAGMPSTINNVDD